MILQPDFLPREVATQLMEQCIDSLDWHEETFSLYGRTLLVPRLVSWAGDKGLDYRYAARSHVASGWPCWLDDVRKSVSSASGQPINHTLLNRYRHGQDYMGWHRDDERGVCGPVLVLSLGARRRLRWRERPGSPVNEVMLPPGSLLTLDGRWQHTLIRDRSCEEERIFLTFRHLFDVKKRPSGCQPPQAEDS
jgi:alkylated DNA repair dioxygenase AlkB